MANEVSVEITIEEKQALRALTKLTKGIDTTTKSATKSVGKMDNAFSSFAGNLAANAVGTGIKFLAGSIKDFGLSTITAAAQTEKLKTQLDILTGSTRVSAALYEDLVDFSATTPFQLNNIAEAGAQLISFGFEADTVKERLRSIGDVAAGSNSDLKEVSLIYGQVAAAGKLTGERLLQFQERAIPIGPAIAKTMGVAESSVKKMVSDGKVQFADFERAFNSMSETGGLFQGAIDKQSKTINGSLSTLGDNFDILKSAIGDAFAPAVIGGAKALTEIFQAMLPLTKTIATNFAAMGAMFFADDEAEKAKANLKGLRNTMEDVLSTTKSVNSVLGEDSWLGRINRSRADARVANIKAEIDKLTASLVKLGETDEGAVAAIASDEFRKFTPTEKKKEKSAPDPTEQAKADARVLKEKAILAEITAIRAEGDLLESERQLMLKEAAGLLTEEDFVKLHDIEAEKLNIRAQAEQDKIDLIKNGNERRLAEEKLVAKTSADFQKLETKRQIDELKRRQALEKSIAAAKLQTAANVLQAGLTLAKEGSVAQKAILSAQAVMNTWVGATAALAPPPLGLGPVFGIPLAASVVAMGLANVAKINGVGFANGGVVGGFVGATPGQDNTSSNGIGLRTGEMVLTATDQKTLFDDIRSRKGGNDVNGVNTALMEIISQPVIIQIDNKEIARATRDAQRDGFRISA